MLPMRRPTSIVDNSLTDLPPMKTYQSLIDEDTSATEELSVPPPLMMNEKSMIRAISIIA